MASDEGERFKRKIDLDAVPGLDATDGVRADWSRLAEILRAEIKGLQLEWTQVHASQSGLGQSDWTWRRRQRQVSISVFVSGTGPRGAREQLVELATDTTMMESPLVRGPEGLGDVAVQYMDRPYENVIWVFRNVCVEVDNEDTGVEIMPLVHRIQAFMQQHLVPAIADHVPVVARVDVSPSPVTVGQTVTVSVQLSGEPRSERLATTVRERGFPRLEWISEEGLGATLEAVQPGRAELDIIVIDEKTLLSPRVAVFLDVLPAP